MTFPRAMARWLGPLLLVTLIAIAGVEPLRAIWGGADPLFLAGAAAINVALLLLKTWRWRLLLAALGLVLPVWPALRVYTIGSALGAWTPGRVGDFSKALALQRELGIEPGRSMASVIADRLLDAAALAAMAAAGAFWLPGLGRVATVAAILALPAGLALAALLRKLRLPAQVGLAFADLRAMAGRVMWPVSGMTAVTALLTFTQALWIARALGLSVGFWTLAAATSAASLSSLVPISVAGLGTREAVMVLLLSPAGLGLPEAIGFSLTQTVVAGGSLALLGALAWMTPSGWTPRRAIP